MPVFPVGDFSIVENRPGLSLRTKTVDLRGAGKVGENGRHAEKLLEAQICVS